MREYVLPVRVGFGDCDPAGIVYYPNFYRWFDDATHAMFRAVGEDMATIKREHGLIAWPLVDTGARFRLPATHGDLIDVHSSIVEWTDKTFRIRHVIKRGEEVLVEGWEVRILGEPVAQDDPAARPKMRAVTIPAAMRAKFEG